MNERRRLVSAVLAALLALAGLAVFAVSTSSSAASSGCVFSNGATAAFCDTFDAPAGTGNRSGDLNGTVWGVSRVTGNQNFGLSNGWATSSLNPCGEASTAPPHDVQVCNGQLRDSVNDGGTVTALAMYPKQPFDFAGRTGRIVFDVSNDSNGNHAAWPELWVSDQPVPTPFAHEGSFISLPRNGFGIRFAGCSGGTCPDGDGAVGVDSAIVVNNHAANDSFNGGSLSVRTLGDVTKSGLGQLNHYEVDVTAPNDIEVYGTDAFTPGGTVPPLKHISSIPNAGLTLTRGVIWVEDVHYNGNKPCQDFGSPICQGDHTFAWDNVGFDGPVLAQDRTFDVLDNSGNLGYQAYPSVTMRTLSVDATSLANATGALVTFGFWDESAPSTFTLTVNGHSVTQTWPYPDSQSFTPKTLAVPVPLADIVTGPNTITWSAGVSANVFNVDIILQGGGGGGGTTTTVAPTTAVPTTTAAPATTQAPTTTSAPTTTTAAPTTTTTAAPISITNVPCTVTLVSGPQSGTCSGTFQP